MHTLNYGFYGHKDKWENSNVVHEAARMDQPLVVYKAAASDGKDKVFSFLNVAQPDQIAVMALKQAEKIAGYPGTNRHLYKGTDWRFNKKMTHQDHLHEYTVFRSW